MKMRQRNGASPLPDSWNAVELASIFCAAHRTRVPRAENACKACKRFYAERDTERAAIETTRQAEAYRSIVPESVHEDAIIMDKLRDQRKRIPAMRADMANEKLRLVSITFRHLRRAARRATLQQAVPVIGADGVALPTAPNAVTAETFAVRSTLGARSFASRVQDAEA